MITIESGLLDISTALQVTYLYPLKSPLRNSQKRFQVGSSVCLEVGSQNSSMSMRSNYIYEAIEGLSLIRFDVCLSDIQG